MENNRVYIHKTECYKYPNKAERFNPSACYPEYRFPNEVSKSENIAYDSIRQCLYNMGFDKENFGTSGWNPLKELIRPGDVVLLKPNMVLHENEIPENGTDCLITHPSLVRAMIDYVVLALNGTGRIIVGDAPLQSCNYEKLVEEQGYLDIIEFYRQKNINVELADFRNYKTVSKGGLLHLVENKSNSDAIVVDLEKKSELSTIEQERYNKLRITNYDHSIMQEHHNSEKNEYSISKNIIDADVIINMPKPKTHRKAGVTISLKNLVGINTNKEWLPHHTIGSVKEGGDEYSSKSVIKKLTTYFTEKKDNAMAMGMKQKARIFYTMVYGMHGLNKVFGREKYSEGSWYGNDTIWRTTLDLNKILFFSDKQGKMKDTKQRRVLVVADMLISGEGEGPLLPTPKNVGIIAMAMNPVCADEAISAIMGFQPSLIPSIRNARNIKHYSFADPNETIITSNNPDFNFKKPSEISYETSLKFKPSKGWKEYFNNQ